MIDIPSIYGSGRLRNTLLVVLVCLFCSWECMGQREKNPMRFDQDSVPMMILDTVVISQKMALVQDSIDEDSWWWKDKVRKPNPQKALWYSALLPGLGQVYNQKYWKIPIVLGGVAGLTYALTWNGQMYTDYFNGYRDLIDDNPESNSYLNLIPKGRTVEDIGKDNLANLLNNKQQAYRRYRDLSIIGAVAFYLFVMLDAYVDAQLYDFDISPDLSMRVQPTMMTTDNGHAQPLWGGVGLQVQIKF